MATTTTNGNDLDAVLQFREQVGTVPPENNLLKRAKDMIFNAEATWPLIAKESGGLKEAFLPYMVVIGFVPGLIGGLISMTLYGMMSAFMGGTSAGFNPMSAVAGSIVHSAIGLLVMAIAGKIVSWVAPSFGLRSSWVLSTRAIVYGSTPVYVAALFFWIPFLGILLGLGTFIWSILLTFRGFKALLAQPKLSTAALSVA